MIECDSIIPLSLFRRLAPFAQTGQEGPAGVGEPAGGLAKFDERGAAIAGKQFLHKVGLGLRLCSRWHRQFSGNGNVPGSSHIDAVVRHGLSLACHLARAADLGGLGHGRFSDAERHHATPTTQTPASRAGRGCAPLTGAIHNLTNAWHAAEVQCNVAEAGKLRLDLPRCYRLPGLMDQDTLELVAQLATKLGMALEDGAPVALTLGTMGDEQRALAAGYLEKSLARSHALLDAILALLH